MSLPGFRQSSAFGKRSEPHTVIIARGNTIRHFTVRPWLMAVLGSALAAVAIGYLLATSYLVLRDDLFGATVARQARMQQAYEDRISALRAQVDRITSRQLLDQQLMENKVSDLLNRQAELSERHSIISPFVQGTALQSGKSANAPIPKPRPDKKAAIELDDPQTLSYAATDSVITGSIFSKILNDRKQDRQRTTNADKADQLFVAINKSLKSIEIRQVEKIRSLTDNAYQTADQISSALGKVGLSINVETGKSSAKGGPLITVGLAKFNTELKQLDEALKVLETIKDNARLLPIGTPLPGAKVTSRFGMRRDPILGSRAMHTGMDFRAPLGAPVKATGAGKVVSAGWNGGYGRMVEIDHGHGIITRYAHLSRISVKKGQRVTAGLIVGKVGSSGRSTGPHLHYEIRHSGKPANPKKFIQVGQKLAKIL